MHDPTNPLRSKSLELALRDALSLGRNYAGSEHILLELKDEEDDQPLDCGGDLAALASDACFPVPGALGDRELRARIGRLSAREHTVSYERRMLHATIDLLRAEQVSRLRQRFGSDSS